MIPISNINNHIYQNLGEDLVALSTPYIKDIPDGYVRAHIIKAIKDIPEQDRKEVLKFTMLCIKDITNAYFQTHIIKLIKRIPKQDRKEVLELSAPYIKDITDGYARTCIIKAIDYNFKQDRKEVLSLFAPYIKDIVDGIARAHLIVFIKDMPKKDRKEVLELAAPYIKDITHDCARVLIIETIEKTPKQDRKEVLELAAPYMNDITNGYCRLSFIRTIRKIPKHDRKYILGLFSPYIKDIANGYVRAHIIEAIKDTPNHDLEEVLKFSVLCTKDITYGEFWSRILETIKKIPKQDRKEVLELAAPYIKDITGAEDRVHIDRVHIIETIKKIPQHNRKEVVKLATLLIPHNLKNSILILSILEFINDNTIIKKTLQKLSTKYASLSDKCIPCWKHLLNCSDKKVVYDVSTFITKNSIALGLHDEHSLFQEAIRVQTLLLPENLNEPLNPYKFFETMKNKRAIEVDFKEIKLPKETLEGIEIQLDPQFFKELSKKVPTLKNISFITSRNLEKMVNALSDRIKKEQSLNQDIKKMTGMNYQSLLSASLGGDKGTVHLYNQLVVQQEKDKPYPIVPAQLKCIIKYIESLSTKRLPNKRFSEQDTSLIKMLASIQNCPTGKDEGIQAYFTNVVPTQFKLGLEKKNQDQGEQLLYAMILDKVRNMFSAQNSFIKYLIEPDPKRQPKVIQEGTHQERYVRNLIGHDVGLPNVLYFDNHTQTLYKSIVDKTKQQVIETFYKFFLPRHIVTKLETKINNSLNTPNSTLYAKLSKLMEEEQLSTSWNSDTNKGDIWINTAGVIHLLYKLGAIKAISKKNSMTYRLKPVDCFTA